MWHVAQWVSRAPPHHTPPAIFNINGRNKPGHLNLSRRRDFPGPFWLQCFNYMFFFRKMVRKISLTYGAESLHLLFFSFLLFYKFFALQISWFDVLSSILFLQEHSFRKLLNRNWPNPYESCMKSHDKPSKSPLLIHKHSSA